MGIIALQGGEDVNMEDTMKVARELQAWLAKIPPLKPLGH